MFANVRQSTVVKAVMSLARRTNTEETARSSVSVPTGRSATPWTGLASARAGGRAGTAVRSVIRATTVRTARRHVTVPMAVSAIMCRVPANVPNSGWALYVIFDVLWRNVLNNVDVRMEERAMKLLVNAIARLDGQVQFVGTDARLALLA